jgi:DNA-binding NtrC family response regulator
MAKIPASILIVDDNEDILQSLRLSLSMHFERIEVQKNPNLIPALLKETAYDLVILDMNFTAGLSSGNEGIFWMGKILEHDPAIALIMITAYGDIDLAVKAIKAGATDFIQKPWNEEKLLATVTNAIKLRKSKLEIRNLRNKQRHLRENIEREFHLITGSSDSMKHVMDMVDKVAVTDVNVLLLGENGTGKEVIAREIHKRSERSEEVFVPVDMAALPETLFESELFGHMKGAFTDAQRDKPGRFEIASGGTLFLDEIGNLSLSIQSKLLSVLQNREITRVGSTQSIGIDIRLISATNKNLQRMVRSDDFREDLLYRINTIQIEIPALRERREDIRLLAEHFLGLYGKKYGKEDLSLTVSAIREMEAYSWPGNIRELRHSIEKAVILTDKDAITPEMLFQKPGNTPELTRGSLNLKKMEKALIKKAIEINRGNLARSARDLGITRKTLYNKIEKFGID